MRFCFYSRIVFLVFLTRLCFSLSTSTTYFLRFCFSHISLYSSFPPTVPHSPLTFDSFPYPLQIHPFLNSLFHNISTIFLPLIPVFFPFSSLGFFLISVNFGLLSFVLSSPCPFNTVFSSGGFSYFSTFFLLNILSKYTLPC